MSLLSRRTVLKAAAASAVFPLFTISGTKASGRVIGANDLIRVGIAGVNGRGTAHIDGFAGAKNVEVACLIDPDSRLYENRTKMVEAKGGNKPRCIADIREALEDKTLDAISVATPNHWHSLITIWACQAGKDVYVEKPISHNVFEGRQCVKAAEKYGRVVQHGTQNRSSSGKAREIAAVQSGKYGELLVSKGYCCKPRWSIGNKSPGNPPTGFDYNLWLGPASEMPYHGNLVHYNWHWFWETGNGDIGNQGVHEMDIARWAIKDGTLPTSVVSMGVRALPNGEKDQGETPNMQLSVMEFGKVLLVFEVRGLVAKKEVPDFPQQVTNEYYTTEGVIKGGKFYPKDGGEAKNVEGSDDIKVAPGGPFGSFIAAMRSRNPADNNCNAEVAHYSAALCHLANISQRMGTSQSADQAAATVASSDVAKEAFAKLVANGAAANAKIEQLMVGPKLTFDPASEKFVDNAAADKLLSRPYREGFVVPTEV